MSYSSLNIKAGCVGKFFGVVMVFALTSILFSAEEKQEWKLWYETPAEAWREALPVGNGRMGAMVSGGIVQDRIQLNEESVWSGSPQNYDRVGAYKYLPEVRKLLSDGKNDVAERMVIEKIMGDRPLGAYQTLGDLWLDFPIEGEVQSYRRELDLGKALARTEIRHNGALFTREVFASFPAQVIVVRLKSDTPGRLEFTVRLNRQEGSTTESRDGDSLVMRGQADEGKPTAGVRFVTQVKAVNKGGQLQSEGGVIRVSGADEVTLYVSAATNYREENPEGRNRAILESAMKTPVDQLQAEQAEDHAKYFDRVRLSFGKDINADKPTDVRRMLVQAGKKDNGLLALFFHYGRYLLISSSREGCLPANLQGIWNDQIVPPWFAGWHFNINVQMNYWPAELVGLGELHMPLLDFVDGMRENGRRTARDVYDCRGFVTAHRTNLWRFTSPVKGLTLWPTGAAWLVQHFWMHYEFTGDRAFLAERAYPAMKESAEFFLDWLVKDPCKGTLVSGPSISPENMLVLPNGKRATLCMAPAMDQQLIAELFDRCLKAAEILGINDDFVKEVRAKRKDLASGTRIGSDGRLMEWAQEYKEDEPGHRHISHLYAAYPGDAISVQKTPELAEAVKNSLIYRITAGETMKGRKGVDVADNSSVEWSLVWNAGIWARLGEAEQLDYVINALMQRATHENMFTKCPRNGTRGVFQIDGNLGGTAVMAEALLQSHTGEINLLPTLPPSWKEGSFQGLRARGGYVVDASWKNGVLEKAGIRASAAGPCIIRTRLPVDVLSEGKRIGSSQKTEGDYLVSFDASADADYQIVPSSID